MPRERREAEVVTANRFVEVRKLLEEIKRLCGIGFGVDESLEEFGRPSPTNVGLNVAAEFT